MRQPHTYLLISHELYIYIYIFFFFFFFFFWGGGGNMRQPHETYILREYASNPMKLIFRGIQTP